MLNDPPITADNEGAKELASKQHSMWFAELLDDSWSANVTTEMSAFEEETKRDGILLFYVFLRENVGYTREAIITSQNHECRRSHHQPALHIDFFGVKRR